MPSWCACTVLHKWPYAYIHLNNNFFAASSSAYNRTFHHLIFFFPHNTTDRIVKIQKEQNIAATILLQYNHINLLVSCTKKSCPNMCWIDLNKFSEFWRNSLRFSDLRNSYDHQIEPCKRLNHSQTYFIPKRPVCGRLYRFWSSNSALSVVLLRKTLLISVTF